MSNKNFAQVPPHTHNGIDCNLIDKSANGINYTNQWTIEETYPSNETDIFTPGFTPRIIYFYGYAVNTSTQESAMVNGQGSSSAAIKGICNSHYIFFTGGTLKQRLTTTDLYLALVLTDTSVDKAHITIDSWTESSITVTATVASGWTLNGNFIIIG